MKDYSSLKKIDFSGITIGSIDLSNLSAVNVPDLAEVVLPDQSGLKFDIEGKWYYLNDKNEKVSLDQGMMDKKNSRVDLDKYSYLKGKSIYRESK